MQVGDRVAWTASWLQRCGFYAAEYANQRGTVQAIGYRTCEVKWDHEDLPWHVAQVNVCKPGSVAFSDPAYNGSR